MNMWSGRYFAIALIILGLTKSLIQAAIIKSQQQTKTANKTPWELVEALHAASGVRGFNGSWITENEFYYTASDKSIRKVNVENQTESIFLTSDFLNRYKSATFTLSPDNTKVLVRYDVEVIFRHSSIAKYDVYNIAENTAINIHKNLKLQYCNWSPVKDRLAYVFQNNVYIHFENDIEVQITTDGIDGIVYNGIPDWVYEEEVLSSGSSLWWSPDGLKLAVGFFNDTKVVTYKYSIYGDADNSNYQYPKEIQLKYPKPGTPNPIVGLRIFDLGTVMPSSVRVTAPTDIVSADHILQSVIWANNTNIVVTWLNRRQNIGTIQSCSHVGVCDEVKRLTEPDGWVTISNFKCLGSGSHCLFTYWIGNWYQVWKLNLQTGENEWESLGDFTVLAIYGYDEVNNKLYYRATLTGDPSDRHVFSNKDCLTCNLIDVDGDVCSDASASFSLAYAYYTVTCSGPNPIYTRIYETKSNSFIRDWEPNTAFRVKLESKLRQTNKYINVTLADGSIGYAKLVLPPNFDESRKYPLIVNVYGGPNSVRAISSFNVGYEAFVTTKREIIYAYIDGRGTGYKGKKLLYSVNNNLGLHEVEDQLYVTEWFQRNLPYVDRERTGIWGWSYGGYMTAKTLEADNDRVFQCGVSVAPVTSWLYYDTIYTERFMGLPTLEDNAKNYNSSSLFGDLENFRTHDFLLMHGSGDDNVHYQHSMLLAKALQAKDIQFEEQTYTDENHGIGNFLPHLYHTIDQFWINCLNLDVDDNEN